MVNLRRLEIRGSLLWSHHNSAEPGERPTLSKTSSQHTITNRSCRCSPQKTVIQERCHEADHPPETNEFYGPLTSHVGELHSATWASVLAGNPHCGSSSLWGWTASNFSDLAHSFVRRQSCVASDVNQSQWCWNIWVIAKLLLEVRIIHPNWKCGRNSLCAPLSPTLLVHSWDPCRKKYVAVYL